MGNDTDQGAYDDARARVPVASTERMLLDEYLRLWPTDPDPPTKESEYWARANARGTAALCLSGGGLGSAAFALGVLQALSRRRLLTGFHYLSTVSGGGYVGGWLQRWIHAEGDADRVMAKLAALGEPPEVTALRPGAARSVSPAGDRWHTAALLLRNTAIFWLMLGPALLLLALVPNLFLELVVWSHDAVLRIRWLHPLYLGLVAAAIAAATFSTLRLLPSYRASPQSGPPLPRSPGSRVIAPMLYWALAAVAATAIYEPGAWLGDDVAIATFAGMVAGLSAAFLPLPGQGRRTLLRDTPLWLLSFAATAVLIAAQMRLIAVYRPDPFAFGAQILGGIGMVTGLYELGDTSFRLPDAVPGGPSIHHYTYVREASFVVLGPLSLMLAHLLGTYVFVAFRRAAAFAQPDADREWMAQLSAAQLKVMMLWSFLGFAALLLNMAVKTFAPVVNIPTVVFIAIASCTIALIASDQSDQATWSGILGFVVKFIPLRFISAVATFAFVASVILVANQFTDILWYPLTELVRDWQWAGRDNTSRVLAGMILATLFGIAAWAIGTRVAMNRFSFTELHRDRLTRMFLGGANAQRDADPFIDFDPGDNVRLHSLAPASRDGLILYPILNASMDVADRHSDERACESFIFSPAYSGAGSLGPDIPGPVPSGAFLSSDIYADDEVNLGMAGGGVTLATAMAISGAGAGAAGSRAQSPSLRLIMTLLNLRSATRLPNPAKADLLGYEVMRSWPSTSLASLLRDLAGATRRDELDIQVGDGGRFDDLGLYEMIRRRCRYILVVDSTIDPELSFTALGNAIRKVKIDFGVDIRFPGSGVAGGSEPEAQPRQTAWAMASIHYPEGSAEPRAAGSLLYFKATVLGSVLPVDVASYAAGNRLFPHELTSGFSITEAQFESHRRLGDSLLTGIGQGETPSALADWFEDAERQAEVGGEVVNLLYESVGRSKGSGAASARSGS